MAALNAGHALRPARMKKPWCLAMLPAMNRNLRPWAALAATLLLAACGSMRSSVVFEPAVGSIYRSSHPQAMPARTAVPGDSYHVVKGDTLYSIAFRNGVDFRDLAQWNGIGAPYTIWPGQRLKLAPSAALASAHAAAAPEHAAPARAAAPTAPVFVPAPAPTTAAASGKPLHPAAGSARPAVAATAPLVPVAGVPSAAPASVPPPMPAAAVAPGASRVISGVTWRWPAQGSLIKRFQSGDAIPGIEIAGNAGDPVRAAADGVVVYSGNGLVGYGELVIIKHSDTFLSAYGHNRKRLVKEGQRVTAGQPIAEMGSTGASRNELEFQIRKDGNPVDPLDYLPPR